MRPVHVAVCLLLFGNLVGCAVIESPLSWGWSEPGKDIPALGPNELHLGDGKVTVGNRLRSANTLNDLVTVISETREAIADQKTAVRAKLDEASGGNFGWGILGAAAAVSSLHVSALKAIALGGGMHVALSTRLSPKDQIGTLSDTISRLGCVADVARANDSANKALAKSADDLKAANAFASRELQAKGAQSLTMLSLDIGAAEPTTTLSLDDFRSAVQNVLFSASNKIDGIFTSALSANSAASDLLASTNTLVTKLKGNAVAANASATAADSNKAILKSNAVSDQVASNVADAQKAVADAKKNADDANATAAVRLAACQS